MELSAAEHHRLTVELGNLIRADQQCQDLLKKGIITEINADKDTYTISDHEEDRVYFIYMETHTSPSAELMDHLKSIVSNYFQITDVGLDTETDPDNGVIYIFFRGSITKTQ